VILIEVPALDPSLEQSIDLQFRLLVCGGYPRVADPHRAKILSRHVLAKKVLAGGSGKVGGERCRRSAQYDAPLATKGRLWQSPTGSSRAVPRWGSEATCASFECDEQTIMLKLSTIMASVVCHVVSAVVL
jgi:hypothetical protein